MASETQITEVVDFNPPRQIKRGVIAPFVDMAALSENQRDISYVVEREFTGGGSRFQNGDTLFARITPCLENGKTAKVNVLHDGIIAHGSTEFIVMTAKAPEYDEDYVYYLARHPEFRAFAEARMEGTSGRQRVSWQALSDFSFTFPSPDIRRSIGSTLRKLDDKIDLNRRTNQTLEAMAQAIFKSWFVDFDPVKAKIAAKQEGRDPLRAAMSAISGKTDAELDALPREQYEQLAATAALFPDEMLGEIPRGWRASQIGDEVIATGGGTPSTQVSEYWDNGTYYWATPRDFSNLSDKVLLVTERKITKEGLSKISSGLLPAGTVLMSSRAPVGYLAITKIPTAVNQGFIAMKCNKNLSPEFCLQWTHHMMDDIKQRASGTTFAEISKSNFRKIPVVVPSKGVMDSYTITVSGLYELIASNAAESTTLRATRDSLLPKLLSGEMSIEGDMNG